MSKSPAKKPQKKARASQKRADTIPKKVHAEIVDDLPIVAPVGPSAQIAGSPKGILEENSAEGSPLSDAAPIDRGDVLVTRRATTAPARRAKTSATLPAVQSSAPTAIDPITTYLREIQKYPLLTREEEYALAQKLFDHKDPAAAHHLVTSNLRFVVKIAAEYSKFGARLIDLVQEGNMGLMHAVRDFNPYKGVRLITYAVWWIRGYIQEYLMKQFSMVKIGTTQAQKKLFYRLQRQKELLEHMSRPEQITKLSRELGVTEEELVSMGQRLSGPDISLNMPVGEDSGTQLQDLQRSNVANIEDELAHQEELRLLRDRVEEIRPQLNERENILLQERLLADEPLTLQEIGNKYGITREAVRQTEARLLQKIRAMFT